MSGLVSRLMCCVGLLALSFVASAPAVALSASECSTKYQAAKAAGTLGDQKWNDFRKAQCGPDASPTATTVPNPMARDTKAGAGQGSKGDAKAEAKADAKADPKPEAKSAAPAASGAAVFPSKIDAKYTKESESKQRMKTCLDQYNVNKANGGNGGLTWIMKGGGYYSECNKRLKG